MEDPDRVGQRGGNGLVDENRLARREDRLGLHQVRPPVDAQEQHGVDLAQQRVDRIDDLDAQLADRFDAPCENLHACGNVDAAARIGGHNLHVRQLSGGLGVVDDLGPAKSVGIQTDDPGLDRRREPLVRRNDRHRRGAQQRKHTHSKQIQTHGNLPFCDQPERRRRHHPTPDSLENDRATAHPATSSTIDTTRLSHIPAIKFPNSKSQIPNKSQCPKLK